ncbi:HET-domain-containing protein [Xylariaceae sp. FL1651]|nr:HET-domain-containing protein [Xylariaceae sp. FL1651]
MRLLNTKSLRLQSFMPGQVPEYVILSHLWGEEEITFEDFTKQGTINPDVSVAERQSFRKVDGACKLAAQDGYNWIWIDTCCIDKSSSAELQEVMNTMWKYYERSNICYVYMADIPDAQAGWTEAFQTSKWFTRGWTLQELIAPTSVEFYARNWSAIGTKSERYKEISARTKIDPDVIVHAEPLDAFSAAERLSWAAHRNVTREEDETYSLLGLFEVNMPLLYGEGRQRAFIRLQEAIYHSTLDHSLFLFRYSDHGQEQPLLADSPACFCPDASGCLSCSKIADKLFPTLHSQVFPHVSYSELIPASHWYVRAYEKIWTTVTSSRNEISTTLPLLDYQDVSDELIFFGQDRPTGISHVAVLNRTLVGHPNGALCLLLFRPSKVWGAGFVRIMSFPALLPNSKAFTSRRQPERILICSGLSNRQKWARYGSITYFTVDDESTRVRSWSSKYVSCHRQTEFQGHASMNFIVESNSSGGYKKLAEVMFRFHGTVEHATQIALRLVWINRSWSIKEAGEVKRHKKGRTNHIRFSSRVLCDRCSIRMSDGSESSISLRKLAAPTPLEGQKTILRYQIIVKRSRNDLAKRIDELDSLFSNN